MANAIIGQPTEVEKVVRHANRMVRLQESIQKAERNGNADKAEALKAELEERANALKAMRDALDAAGV